MTVGIYLLKFIGTTSVYVGQSSNIEKRFSEHIRNMRSGIAKPKLQEAYITYGEPSLEILIDNCDLSDLDILEAEAIEIFNSVTSGFNSLDKPGNPDVRGYDSCHAKFSKDTYIEIYKLLANTNLSIKEISEKTGTTTNVVQRIWSGYTHVWLQKELPEEYSKILKIRKYGRYTKNTDRALISPEGQIFLIEKISEFCREHNLDRGHITRVLSGERKSHKGWHKPN